jgi:hypothetical protein
MECRRCLWTERLPEFPTSPYGYVRGMRVMFGLLAGFIVSVLTLYLVIGIRHA